MTANDKKITAENKALKNLCLRMLHLLENMQSDGGARLPYPGFVEAVKDLKAIIA